MNSLWDTAVGQAITELIRRTIAFLPNIVGAIGLALVGWLVAIVLRVLSARLLRGVLAMLSRQPWIGQALERSRLGPGFAGLASQIIFWFVVTLFVAAAVERLELPLAATLATALAAYLPKVLAGVGILFAASVAGHFARTGIVRAADLLGIQSTLLTVVVAVSLGALLGGATLAFGLGSSPAVANIIAVFYILKTYRVGQHVRVGDVEGEIVEITQTGVFIAVPEGRMLVPGRRFTDEVSLLVTGGRV